MSSIDRLPPHNIEAEEALLGSLLIDPDALFEVSTFLKPSAFYREANKWIYEAILDLNDRRQPLDFITLTDELRRRDQLEDMGGEAYLIGLINTVPTSINAGSYGRIVEAAALRRRMVSAAGTIANLAYEEAEDINVVIDRAEQALFSISEERTTRDLVPVKEIAREYLDRIEELNARGDDIIGVPTGFTDLDRLLGGLNKSDLVIVAARPGMGKCVAADTRLVNPHTGVISTIEEMVRNQQPYLLTLTEQYKLQPAQASHFVDDGLKPVYRVRTALGREIKVTLSHPFLTVTGWRRLEELSVGDSVAVPRTIPVFGSHNAPEHEVKVLAYLLGDGCLTGASPQFTNKNPQLREDFTTAVGVAPGVVSPAISRRRNSLTVWLQEQGVWGKGAAEKDVPTTVYQYTRDKLALFLNRLFACDDTVYVPGNGQAAVAYNTISPSLAHAIQHLLLRFGIIAKLRHRQIRYQDSYRPTYELRIADAHSLATFAEEIGAFGKEDAVAQVKVYLQEKAINTNSEQMVQLAGSDIYWDKIVSIDYLGEQQVYDLTVPETHNFVANDVIVHNTAFQNNIALSAARRHGKRVAIFNLEMSGEQLVQRMIAMETRIDSQRLRRGSLQDNEWPIFYEAIGRLSETRIFIDDTPSITPMQLRTKCRRLYAEHGLDLIMIDYLQLMQSERMNNNRVQEISEISRALKGLARELDVPVLAAAQLSRAVEQRQDKRPVLSDLRDSGCLTGDTLITLADSGRRVRMDSLVGQAGFKVWALNEDTWQIEAAVVSNAFSNGIKPVYRLTTRLGRTIRATANHKFRAFEGWKRLDELQPGDHLALPRKIDNPISQTMKNEELALLGHLIGDGCVLPRHAIQYTTREKDLAELVASLTQDVFGEAIAPRIQQERTWYQVYLSSTRHHTHGVRSVISEWFDELGIFGLRSHEKFIPEKIFEQPCEAIALFLRHLWATDGCIRLKPGFYSPAVYYASSSEQLARDVQSLLLRLNINAWLRKREQNGKGRPQYHVTVSGKLDLECFVNVIGTVGSYKKKGLVEVAEYIRGRKANTNRDVIPYGVWHLYALPAMKENNMTRQQFREKFGNNIATLQKQNISRDRAARLAETVQSIEIARLAESDIYWDQVVSIEANGEEETFDLTVPKLSNFIANHIVAHNSIEQDADVVMFIYRDEYYNPDSTERPNIAEINITKHRNGPTGVIDLYWHGQLATFRNLQRQEISL